MPRFFIKNCTGGRLLVAAKPLQIDVDLVEAMAAGLEKEEALQQLRDRTESVSLPEGKYLPWYDGFVQLKPDVRGVLWNWTPPFVLIAGPSMVLKSHAVKDLGKEQLLLCAMRTDRCTVMVDVWPCEATWAPYVIANHTDQDLAVHQIDFAEAHMVTKVRLCHLDAQPRPI